MSKLRYVGLDVHKDSIVMAVAQANCLPAEVVARIEWCESTVLRELRKLGPLSSLRVCYEAGPTGYGLQRFLAAAGVDCVVIAPALIPQSAGSHVKTDRRDACKLAQFLRSGHLTSIWIPDEQTEALRDLERARDDARLAERRIRQQLLKFLLRHGRRYTPGREHWTKTHWEWVREQKFSQEAQQRVLADAIQTAVAAGSRVARLDEDISQCIPGWALAPLVKNLQALRGIQQVTAVGIAAEIGDFERFPRASKFMAFLGLVPRENSSGQTRHLGGLTKTGNGHVRRLLIEAAWHYFNAPLTISAKLAQRREGVPDKVIEIADRCLRRLRRKASVMQSRRKTSTKIVAALARELAGFVWAIGRATAVPIDGAQSKNSPSTTTRQRRVPKPRVSGKKFVAAGATR